jgi:hypothetical protein
MSLIHHPVYDKRRRVVTTSITNLDLHDLARLAKTFGLGGLYIVQPSKLQVELATRIIDHWESGAGAAYNETRRIAFEMIKMVPGVLEMVQDVREKTGKDVRLVATTGRDRPGQVDYGRAKKILKDSSVSIIMFGTGWGLSDELVASSDVVLEPIVISDDYNHLSVRCAAAIIIDRLFGK